MRCFVLFILAFGSEQRETIAEDGAVRGESGEINPILVKIEEDEFVKKRHSSKFIGVTRKLYTNWQAQRRSKHENKMFFNGHYETEEAAARASDTLARKLIKNGEEGHKMNFPDDETEVYASRDFSSKFIGVSYVENKAKWRAQRSSKNEKMQISNGYHDTEEAAAHASDTLARNLMKNGEQGHKLNFPNDKTEINAKRASSSKFIGVTYYKINSKWRAQRCSKAEHKIIHNGQYENEEAAAHASDTLARKFMQNGEQGHKLNFPDDESEIYAVKRDSSKFIGVSYRKKSSKWQAKRCSKNEKRQICNGYHDTEEAAAHASDTLARKLRKNGEQGHKLNFPGDDTENAHKKKRKRSEDLGILQDN